jgi:SAM-dependent methyltransferase
VLDYLPQVQYHGFDISPRYIVYARRKYGKVGRFYCQRFDAAATKELEPFDLVLMAGLLHHLNDQELLNLLALSKQALKSAGSLVTLDPYYETSQSPIARFLLNRDRGDFIRERSAYVRLASSHDFFYVPYTKLVKWSARPEVC